MRAVVRLSRKHHVLLRGGREDGCPTFGVVVAEEDIGSMVIGLVPILLCPNFIMCPLCLCQTLDFRRVQPFFILSMPKISFYNNGDEVRRRWARYLGSPAS